MASGSSARTGTIDWVDLTTADVESALTFYARALHWTYETSSTAMGTYHVAKVGGHDAAGLMAAAPGSETPAMWLVFVRVASVDETMAAVANAGGTVLAEPFDIPGGARVGVAADPLGAVFAVIAGGPEPGPDQPLLRRAEPGAVAWCELLSRDPHAVVNFYDAVFGWRPELDPGTGYAVLRLDGADVGGLLTMPAEVPEEAPSHWLVYFTVDDVTAAVNVAAAAGGAVLRAPADAGSPTAFAVLADPQGATFGLMEPDRD